MMYYCENCDELFDEEDAHYEDCGFYTEVWGHQEYQEFWELQCPYCRSTELEEATTCSCCGEYFKPNELDDDCLCEDCRQK